jgi:predicted Zn-dependent peptidase
MTGYLLPMPGVDFKTATAKFEQAIAHILDEPLTATEIDTARKRNAAWADSASRRPDMFLNFLENVGSDGLPPISPGTFSDLIKNTSDSEVVSFLQTLIAKGATSVLFAAKED